ncbi:MAG: glycoside hydrolase family 2 TIM barrel-domain containing protein [Niabella sp.]
MFNQKILFILIALLNLFTAAQTQELTGERKQLFNDNWRFFLGDNKNAGTEKFQDKDWRTLDLPHDWSIEGRVDPKNPTGNDGGYFPAGIGWYRKTFRLPAALKGKQISVYFEGVYMNAEVFINGKSLGVRPYGYSSFYHNLTPYIKYDAENTIAVRVDNAMQKNSRWYSGSGIYRHVWIYATDPVHIDHWGVIVHTTEVSKKRATVQLKTTVVNKTGAAKNIVLSGSLLNENDQRVGAAEVKVQLPANSKKEVVQNITVSNPELWSPETPRLYTAQLAVKQNGKELDKTTEPFGIRSIQFSADKGFELNGQTVKLNGGCVHHDNGCLGAAAYDRAEERKAELLKAAGFNAVRTAHNPPSEAFLHACDKLGLLVIDESFDGWRTAKTKYDYAVYFDKWAKADIDAMVKRDRNHPSIIMWSIGNEIIERKDPQAVETAKMLAGYVKESDATRPVTSAMTTWDKDWEIFDPLMAVHDVAGYNYQLHRAPSDHARVPSRVIVQTESYPRDAFANWKLVKENNYIIGDFVWTAMDYLGESGIGRWYYSGDVTGEHYDRDLFPWHGAYCGDIDLLGWRKPISHYRSMLYNNTEKLYLAVKEPEPAPLQIKETLWSVWPTWESWNWPGFEGKNIEVEVYSKYPEVRLYLNGKLIGEKPTTEQEAFKAVFAVPYAAGELKAVGVDGDREAETRILRTAGKAAKIKLTADRTSLLPNGQDLSFIAVEIVDEKGNILPGADNKLQFKIEGPGVVAGVDNADLKDTDPYVSDTRKVWKGKALVVVKSKKTAGDIRLSVSADGLPGAVILIRSEKK